MERVTAADLASIKDSAARIASLAGQCADEMKAPAAANLAHTIAGTLRVVVHRLENQLAETRQS